MLVIKIILVYTNAILALIILSPLLLLRLLEKTLRKAHRISESLVEGAIELKPVKYLISKASSIEEYIRYM